MEKLDDTWIDWGADFLHEITDPNFEDKMKCHEHNSKNEIWCYKKTTSMRLYFLNRRTWIFKLVEEKWGEYLQGYLHYPETSFSKYLLTQKWGAEFRQNNVEMEIKIWYDVKNKILQ